MFTGGGVTIGVVISSEVPLLPPPQPIKKIIENIDNISNVLIFVFIKGDLIITSGQANRYIASLKIGRVVEVIKKEGERFVEATIEPLEVADNISEVVISGDEN